MNVVSQFNSTQKKKRYRRRVQHIQTEVLSEPTDGPLESRQSLHRHESQANDIITVKPVGWDRRGQPGWAEDLDARDRRCLLRSRCDERSPRRIAGQLCWPNRASREGMHGGRRAVSPCIHAGSNDVAFRWLSQLCRIVREGQFSGNSAQKGLREHCMVQW